MREVLWSPLSLAWRRHPRGGCRGLGHAPTSRSEKGLQTVSQQRRSHCVQRWLVGTRAIEAQQTLATLLKGRDPSGSQPFALHEYARISLSVHEAQLLVEHLTLADRTLLDKVAASTRGGIADRLARRAWMSQRLGVAQAVA